MTRYRFNSFISIAMAIVLLSFLLFILTIFFIHQFFLNFQSGYCKLFFVCLNMVCVVIKFSSLLRLSFRYYFHVDSQKLIIWSYFLASFLSMHYIRVSKNVDFLSTCSRKLAVVRPGLDSLIIFQISNRHLMVQKLKMRFNV